jgi:sigma-54 dependent transcriptional regulator, acetoin dehydrogenase operon transcriptional activator AcoR
VRQQPGSETTRRDIPAQGVRHARELVLGGEGPVDDQLGALRDEIQASWLRSRRLQVDSDHLAPAHTADVDHETLLGRSAGPVLEHLKVELAGEPVGILLTDAAGTVLQRHCADPELSRQLDAALLTPGFVYTESSVGTNGIGTAIEVRLPTMIIGEEHYADSLTSFACAAAPIYHPITNAFLGVIDFTATAPHASPLLLSFARSTSQRVHEAMLAQSSPAELALMRDYLSACHHSGGAVLALSDELVMMNVQTQLSFDAADQTALLAKLGDVAGARSAMSLLADLPSGTTARLEYRPTFANEDLAGGVFRVQARSEGSHRPRSARQPTAVLPGVVGLSPSWQQACRAVRDSRRRGEWLVLEGEPGVGKLTLLQGAQKAADPRARFRVLDENDAASPERWVDAVAEELESDGGSLVLRHVDLLEPELVDSLTEMLLRHSGVDADTGPWVALTMSGAEHNSKVEAQLLPHFPHTVVVPALRHHIEDVTHLVPHLLGRMSHGQELSVTPAVLNHLMKLPWYGNVEQLRRVLVKTAKVRRSGVIVLDDLPAECRAITRRRLSQMESLERDALITALVAHGGRKERAASALGLSRATVYRKIKDYGITV